MTKRYFKVEAKCGHVGHGKCIWITFATAADNGKEAARKVRDFKRVKHDHKDAIRSTTEIDFEEIKSKAVPFEKWNDVLAVMSRYSKAITSAFDGTAAYISGDYILIDSENEMPFLLLKQPLQRDKMRTAIRQVTGRVYKLGPYNQVKATQKEDPLNDFVNKAKQQGIDVKTN